MKLNKTSKAIAQQLIVHHRVYFKLCYNEKGELYKIENVSPEKVRVARDKITYFMCDDWSARIDVVPIKRAHPTNRDLEQLYVYEIMTLGQEWYSLPQYTSALNFAFLSGELSYFAKSNIQNSIFPSFAMMFPKRPQSEEEKHMIKNTIDRLKGAANSGKAVAFFANSADQLPKIEALPTNNNDKLFHEASALNTEQICFSHTIDPILMGVRTTGALGGGADIKQAYVVFEKNVVMPLRDQVEEIVNELLALAKIPGKYMLNNFQIINETIVEIDDNVSKISDIINSVNPVLAAKIIESMTQNELRELIHLQPIETPAP
jgi:capsid portal protein